MLLDLKGFPGTLQASNAKSLGVCSCLQTTIDIFVLLPHFLRLMGAWMIPESLDMCHTWDPHSCQYKCHSPC